MTYFEIFFFFNLKVADKSVLYNLKWDRPQSFALKQINGLRSDSFQFLNLYLPVGQNEDFSIGNERHSPIGYRRSPGVTKLKFLKAVCKIILNKFHHQTEWNNICVIMSDIIFYIVKNVMFRSACFTYSTRQWS